MNKKVIVIITLGISIFAVGCNILWNSYHSEEGISDEELFAVFDENKNSFVYLAEKLEQSHGEDDERVEITFDWDGISGNERFYQSPCYQDEQFLSHLQIIGETNVINRIHVCEEEIEFGIKGLDKDHRGSFNYRLKGSADLEYDSVFIKKIEDRWYLSVLPNT